MSLPQPQLLFSGCFSYLFINISHTLHKVLAFQIMDDLECEQFYSQFYMRICVCVIVLHY